MKTKIQYILSDVEKSLAFEWVAQRLNSRPDYELSFILIGKKHTPLSQFLRAHNIPVWEIGFSQKHHMLTAFFVLLKIFFKVKPEIIHVHLFEAGRLAIPAGWLLNIKKRIYTRHYSTYHHAYFPRAVYYDKLINRLATKIISISSVVTNVLVKQENVDPKKIVLIPHGFDFSYFTSIEAEISGLKKKYDVRESLVVGVVSRYDRYKGVEYIIDAVSKLQAKYKDIHIIFANARGERQNLIQDMLQKHLQPGSYTEIEFEENSRALYSLFDVFVHVPIDADSEAFGQVYIEALAMKVPSIFTLSGIAHDFVKNRFNALVVDYKSSESIYVALETILKDSGLRELLKENGAESVKMFNIETMLLQLEGLYEN